MEKSSSQTPLRARLFLGERAWLEIRLNPTDPEALPTWLAVRIPGPRSRRRPQGRFLAHPGIPESEIELVWSRALASSRSLRVLTISAAGRSWVLEQDINNPSQWLMQGDPDTRRFWSS